MLGKLQNFRFENKEQNVTFLETIQVVPGVFCDVYEFQYDSAKDLGVITIDSGCATPRQKVLKGQKTTEGYLSGEGKLVINKHDGTETEYEVNESTEMPFEITVSVGEIMQWQSTGETSLTVYEICSPPYEDGRFENLKD